MRMPAYWIVALASMGFVVSLMALGCDEKQRDQASEDEQLQAVLQGLDDEFPHHRIPRVEAARIEDLTVDGRLDEPLWDELPSLSLSPIGGAEARRTAVQVAYSEQAIVVGAYLEDEHVWSTLKERDADLWTEEVIELFLAPEGADGPYVELQVNALGTIFDATFEQPLGQSPDRRAAIDQGRAWNLEDLQVAVHVEGQINDEDHTDQFWSVEMIIPFAGLPFGEADADLTAPKPGDVWRANFFRFDRPADGSRHAYGWSTALRGDFHQPDRFGYWVF